MSVSSTKHVEVSLTHAMHRFLGLCALASILADPSQLSEEGELEQQPLDVAMVDQNTVVTVL